MNTNFSTRDKAILTGLFLSKFDEHGLKELGFEGFHNAFNVLGYAVGVKPASIKNYRDEFDPYFPNQRKGWHKRALREYCKKHLDNFSALNLNDFADLIKSFVIQDYDIEKIVRKSTHHDASDSVAKRIITGKAAEEYFKVNYRSVGQFVGHTLKDTTYLACGFDFKLSLESDFYCAEVKGLNTNSGSITLTEKEFWVANELKHRYCLFIVSNFIETPNHQAIFDPLCSRLVFKKMERQVTQVNYSASI
jgi:hypothetical protein